MRKKLVCIGFVIACIFNNTFMNSCGYDMKTWQYWVSFAFMAGSLALGMAAEDK